MEKTVAGVGIFCIIAAIVGGGFNAPGGFAFPRLASGRVRGILAAFGCVLILIPATPALAKVIYTAASEHAARLKTDQVRAKLTSIRFLDDQTWSSTNWTAANQLRAIGQIEFEIQTKSGLKNNRVVRLSDSEIEQARQREQQAISQFHSAASEIVGDWRAGAEAVSLSEANLPKIRRLERLNQCTDKLWREQHNLLLLRNDLLLAATIATQDSVPAGTTWDQITRAALGLQQHAASALKNMRQSWDSVASALNR